MKPTDFRKLGCKTYLAATAVLTLLVSPAGHAASPHDQRTDLGAISPGATVTAMIWLKAQGTSFDLALASRTTPGSADYRKWMTPAEVASYGATENDLRRLSTALRDAGMGVTQVPGDNAVLKINGTAAAVQAAFGTAIHRFSQGGRMFRANLSEPHFSGPGAELIDAISGLSTEPMMPQFLEQANLLAGATFAHIPAGGVLNPYTVFTDNCFKTKMTFTLAQVVPMIDAKYVGPEYTTKDLPGKQFKNCGYTPSRVAPQYGLPAVYAKGFHGEAQTIVIVDAYGSPTIQSDANVFSKMMKLPQLSAQNFQVVYPDGPPISSPYTTNWPEEISLDVEWAHAIAPMAKIVLVVAPSDDPSELAYAVHYAAVKQLGDVMSNSYGSPEAGSGPEVARMFGGIIKRAAAQGIAVNVSSGDSGDFGLGTPVGAASIPADSPFATAVGGTSLNVPGDTGPVDTAWGTNLTALGGLNKVDAPPFIAGFKGGSGGGESLYFEKPSWQAQAGIPGVGRQVPDISAVADPLTGVIIVSDNGSGTAAVLLAIGGTSVSSPVFSGIWALAQQAAHGRLGQAAPIIAGMPRGAVRDIVPILATKSNLAGSVTQAGVTTSYNPSDLLGLTATQPNGFVGVGGVFAERATVDLSFGSDTSLGAAPGWDNATGFGEPNGYAFIKAAGAAMPLGAN